jgi:hypothetical protein
LRIGKETRRPRELKMGSSGTRDCSGPFKEGQVAQKRARKASTSF